MTSNERTEAMSAAMLALFALPVVVGLSMMWRGWVLSILWGWFAVTTFGAPPLSVPAAIGVSMLVGMLTYHKPVKGDPPSMAEAIGIAAVYPLLALGMGWVVKGFMS